MSVSPDWGKIRLVRVVGAMEKANPNIAPGYAKLRSMNIAGTWMTAIATNVGIIHADISSEWKKNMKESLMNNLSEMRRLGMDVFLRNENAK